MDSHKKPPRFSRGSVTHKFSQHYAIQHNLINAIASHYHKTSVYPQRVTVNPAHQPYAKLFLSASVIKAVGSEAVAMDEVVTL